MKAEKPPNDRQSRLVRGRVKLNAKMMKSAELIRTNDHNPYADMTFTSSERHLNFSLMSLTAAAVFAMSAMHEEVHERARQQKQIRENAEQVRPVFREKEEPNNRQKDDEHEASSRSEPTAVFWLMFGVHSSLLPGPTSCFPLLKSLRCFVW